MIELYENIRPEVKETAKIAWNLALQQKDAHAASEFLNTVIEYYKQLYTIEEIEFLQFYFHMQMEMMKE